MPGEMFDFIQPVMSGKEMWYLADCFKNYARYMLFAQSGKVSLDQEWNVSGADYCRFDVEEENGEFTLVIEEVQDSCLVQKKQTVRCAAGMCRSGGEIQAVLRFHAVCSAGV